MNLSRTLVRGAVGGLVGTSVMSVVMLGAQKMGLLGKMPPERITEAGLRALGLRTSKAEKHTLATAAHFAYGVAGGVLFASLTRRHRALPSPVAGAIFGTTVWAASYMGWIPAVGILPPPRHDRPGRPTAMVLAHIVYGLVLGAAVDRDRAPRGSDHHVAA